MQQPCGKHSAIDLFACISNPSAGIRVERKPYRGKFSEKNKKKTFILQYHTVSGCTTKNKGLIDRMLLGAVENWQRGASLCQGSMKISLRKFLNHFTCISEGLKNN